MLDINSIKKIFHSDGANYPRWLDISGKSVWDRRVALFLSPAFYTIILGKAV